jgi:hypothetical protein
MSNELGLLTNSFAMLVVETAAAKAVRRSLNFMLYS